MAVRIRLARHGRTHRPFYRIVAIDRRCHREGLANEILGIYDPLLPEKNLQISTERLEAWVKQGAEISVAMGNLLKHFGYQIPAPVRTGKPHEADRKAKDGKKWVKPTRRALRKHAAKLKGERMAKLAAETAAKKAATAEAKPAEGAAAEAPKA